MCAGQCRAGVPCAARGQHAADLSAQSATRLGSRCKNPNMLELTSDQQNLRRFLVDKPDLIRFNFARVKRPVPSRPETGPAAAGRGGGWLEPKLAAASLPPRVNPLLLVRLATNSTHPTRCFGVSQSQTRLDLSLLALVNATVLVSCVNRCRLCLWASAVGNVWKANAGLLLRGVISWQISCDCGRAIVRQVRNAQAVRWAGFVVGCAPLRTPLVFASSSDRTAIPYICSTCPSRRLSPSAHPVLTILPPSLSLARLSSQ